MQNIINSINDFNEAKQVILGGVNSPVRAFKSVNGTPRFIKSGNGAFIVDEDNNSYIDYVQSYGPLILGHAFPSVVNIVCDVASKGFSFGAPTELETILAKEIIQIYKGIDKIRLVNSGTEATMSAIRLARAYTKCEDIIKFEGCYHGHNDSLLVKGGSGLATFGQTSSLGVIEDIAKHTLVAKYNDIDSFKECLKLSQNIACVIIEPIAGNMGLVPAKKDFLQEIREICTKRNIVLILDEVMSGFRSAIDGSYPFYEVEGDLITLGKVIGGGLPLAAFGGNCEIMNLLSPIGGVYQAGTLSGNPLAVAAGIATILEIKNDQKLYLNLESLGTRFIKGFEKIAFDLEFNLQTCIRGSMIGFFFNEKNVSDYNDALSSDTKLFAKFHAKMLERGVNFAPSQFETSFICKPFTTEIIDSTLEKIKDSLKEIKANI